MENKGITGVQYMNGTLIVAIGGNVYTKMGDEAELMQILQDIVSMPKDKQTDEFLKSIKDRMGINEMFKTNKQLKREANESLIKAINDLPNGFTSDGDKIFYGDYKVTLPKVLFERIVSANDEGDTATFDMLVNFWKNALLCPNSVSREDMFSFLEKYDFKITPSGHFLAFRNVNIKPGDKVSEYADMVFEKMRDWKRNPRNANIVMVDGELDFYDTKKKDLNKYLKTLGEYGSYEVLGTAYDLRVSNKETIYTDAHTGTFDIRLLEAVTMDRSACDEDPNSSCSYGLHLGTPNFVSDNFFGCVTISALVHPRDVIAVPNHDTNKMRVCRYFPLEVVDGEVSEYDISDEDIIKYDSLVSEYISDELDVLLTNQTLEDLKESKTIPDELTLENLENLQVIIEGRVVDIEAF